MVNLTTQQIKHGIIRCLSRQSGVMPKGLMTDKMINDALVQYRLELEKRGQTELELNL